MGEKRLSPHRGDDSRLLMEKAGEGDRRAFDKVAASYANMVIAIAFKMLSSREEAMDCAQDAFVRAWENASRYDSRWSVATWLRKIVTNLALDRLRRRRSILHFPEEMEQTTRAEVDGPDEVVEKKERAQQVREMLDLLPEKYRAVLVLREMEGLDIAEISRITGAQAATVRWRLHRARALFKDRWLAMAGQE